MCVRNATHLPEVSQATLDAEASLYKWNMWMGIMHFVQAAAILTLSQTVTQMKNFKLPLLTHYLNWDSGFPEDDTQERGTIKFAAACSIFSFLSALFHGIVIMNFDTYTHNLRKGINKYRWWEYSLSSSVMIGLIAMLFGIYDVVTLTGLVTVNALMNLFGLLFEVMNSNLREAGITEVDWSAFIYGSFAGVVPWAMIFAWVPAASSKELG